MKTDREVIDHTKCTLPSDHFMYKVVGTYGQEFSAFVSATNERNAKQIFKKTYDFLSPKILSVEIVSANHEMLFDRSKLLILGKMDIIEKRYSIEEYV